MPRLPWLRSAAALVSALVLFGACSSSAPSGSGGSGGAGGVDEELARYLADLVSRCLPETGAQLGLDPFTGEALLMAREAYAGGQEDIPLTPSGCTRYLVEKRDGVIINEGIVGPPFAITAKGQPMAGLTVWSFEMPGQESFVTDRDADGFFESRGVTEYEKQAVVEEHAPSDDAVVARTQAVVSPDGRTLTVTREDAASGQLKETGRFVAAVSQRACDPAGKKPDPIDPNAKQPADLNTRPCKPAELTAVSDAMATAAIAGSGCLFAAGDRRKSDALLRAFVRTDFKIECTDDNSEGFVAANDRGYANLFPGKGRLIFHSSFSGEGATAAFRAGTVAHELLHFMDVHDPDLEAAATEAHLRLTDPVYACEYACFGTTATTCHLAACLGKKLSGKSCGGTLDSDVIQKVEMARGKPLAACTSGHQVGALCRDTNFGTEVRFCTTELECNAMCSGNCESKSLSCDPSCR